MSLINETARSLCNKLATEFNKQIMVAKNAAINVNRSLKYDVILELGRASFTDPSELDSIISDFRNDVLNTLPGSTDEAISTFFNLTNASSFFSSDDIFSFPLSIKKNLMISLNDIINGFIFDLSDLYPEFKIGSLLSDLNFSFSLGGLNISGLLNNAQKILSDLAADICGGEFGSIIAGLQDDFADLCEDMYIDNNPFSSNYLKLDIDSIFSEAGISGSSVSNMTNVINSISDAQSSVISSVETCSEVAKDYLFSI